MSGVDLRVGDCLQIVRDLPDDSIDLLFTSPPYEDVRTYGIGFSRKAEDWVEWMTHLVGVWAPKVRGLIAIVCEGKTRNYRNSLTPFLLMADLHRAGHTLRKPCVYKRFGISGSGGPDWLRNDWEPIVCVSRPGRLPWSDNTACGRPPKFPPGGSPTSRSKNGERKRRSYKAPAIANPGNVIDCGAVGGNNIGSKLAHENEAPFPLRLAEFFVRSFCPPGGVVLDPFCGSGTTMHAAVLHGRKGIGIDVRESQVELTKRRLAEIEKQKERLPA